MCENDKNDGVSEAKSSALAPILSQVPKGASKIFIFTPEVLQSLGIASRVGIKKVPSVQNVEAGATDASGPSRVSPGYGAVAPQTAKERSANAGKAKKKKRSTVAKETAEKREEKESPTGDSSELKQRLSARECELSASEESCTSKATKSRRKVYAPKVADDRRVEASDEDVTKDAKDAIAVRTSRRTAKPKKFNDYVSTDAAIDETLKSDSPSRPSAAPKRQSRKSHPSVKKTGQPTQSRRSVDEPGDSSEAMTTLGGKTSAVVIERKESVKSGESGKTAKRLPTSDTREISSVRNTRSPDTFDDAKPMKRSDTVRTYTRRKPKATKLGPKETPTEIGSPSYENLETNTNSSSLDTGLMYDAGKTQPVRPSMLKTYSNRKMKTKVTPASTEQTDKSDTTVGQLEVPKQKETTVQAPVVSEITDNCEKPKKNDLQRSDKEKAETEPQKLKTGKSISRTKIHCAQPSSSESHENSGVQSSINSPSDNAEQPGGLKSKLEFKRERKEIRMAETGLLKQSSARDPIQMPLLEESRSSEIHIVKSPGKPSVSVKPTTSSDKHATNVTEQDTPREGNDQNRTFKPEEDPSGSDPQPSPPSKMKCLPSVGLYSPDEREVITLNTATSSSLDPSKVSTLELASCSGRDTKAVNPKFETSESVNDKTCSSKLETSKSRIESEATVSRLETPRPRDKNKIVVSSLEALSTLGEKEVMENLCSPISADTNSATTMVDTPRDIDKVNVVAAKLYTPSSRRGKKSQLPKIGTARSSKNNKSKSLSDVPTSPARSDDIPRVGDGPGGSKENDGVNSTSASADQSEATTLELKACTPHGRGKRPCSWTNKEDIEASLAAILMSSDENVDVSECNVPASSDINETIVSELDIASFLDHNKLDSKHAIPKSSPYEKESSGSNATTMVDTPRDIDKVNVVAAKLYTPSSRRGKKSQLPKIGTARSSKNNKSKSLSDVPTSPARSDDVPRVGDGPGGSKENDGVNSTSASADQSEATTLELKACTPHGRGKRPCSWTNKEDIEASLAAILMSSDENVNVSECNAPASSDINETIVSELDIASFLDHNKLDSKHAIPKSSPCKKDRSGSKTHLPHQNKAVEAKLKIPNSANNKETSKNSPKFPDNKQHSVSKALLRVSNESDMEAKLDMLNSSDEKNIPMLGIPKASDEEKDSAPKALTQLSNEVAEAKSDQPNSSNEKETSKRDIPKSTEEEVSSVLSKAPVLISDESVAINKELEKSNFPRKEESLVSQTPSNAPLPQDKNAFGSGPDVVSRDSQEAERPSWPDENEVTKASCLSEVTSNASPSTGHSSSRTATIVSAESSVADVHTEATEQTRTILVAPPGEDNPVEIAQGSSPRKKGRPKRSQNTANADDSTAEHTVMENGNTVDAATDAVEVTAEKSCRTKKPVQRSADETDGKGLSGDDSDLDSTKDEIVPAHRRGRPPGSISHNGRRGRRRGQTQKRLDREYVPRERAAGDQKPETEKSDAAEEQSNSYKPKAGISAVPEVECGKCKKTMSKKSWSSHNLMTHNDMGWLSGQPEPDFKNNEKLLRSVLQAVVRKKKRKVCFVCEVCGAEKRSANGFISHLEVCGKTDDERAALLVTCPICGNKLMSSSAPMHERFHRQLEKSKQEVAKLPVVTADSGKGKRKAAEKAATKITEFTDLIKEDHRTDEDMKSLVKIRDTKNPPSRWRGIWKVQLVEKGKAACRHPGCNFLGDTIASIIEHSSNCSCAPRMNYMCRICNFSHGLEEEVTKHVKSEHPSARFKTPNADSDFECKDESSSSSEYDPDESCDDTLRRSVPTQQTSTIPKDPRPFNPNVKFLWDEGSFYATTYYLPAVRWTMKFECKNYRLRLFEKLSPNAMSRLSDDEARGYLPKLETSMRIKDTQGGTNADGTGTHERLSGWITWQRFQGKMNDAICKMDVFLAKSLKTLFEWVSFGLTPNLLLPQSSIPGEDRTLPGGKWVNLYYTTGVAKQTQTFFVIVSVDRARRLDHPCCAIIQHLKLEREHDNYTTETPTLFAGGPVWAVAWLTIPAVMYAQEVDQYVAVSTHPTMESVYSVGKSHTGKNLIQIWNLGNLDNRKESVAVAPRFAYGIAHNNGTIWCLEWCPSGCYEHSSFLDEREIAEQRDSRKRMGLLAAACSDGCVHVYSLPFIDKDSLPSAGEFSSNDLPIYETRPLITLLVSSAMHEKAEQTWQCTKLNWSRELGHDTIIAGFSNGYIAMWDLHTESPFFVTKRDDTTFIEPFHHFYAHGHAVSFVQLIPYGNKRFFASASYDRSTKIWDLEDTSYPLSATKRGSATDGAWLTHWPAYLTAYDDVSVAGSSTYLMLFRQAEVKAIPLLPAKSSSFTVDVSDYGNSVAHGTMAGEILVIFNQHLWNHREMERDIPMKRAVASVVEVVDLSKESLDAKKKKKKKPTVRNNDGTDYTCMPATYEECRDQFGIVFRRTLSRPKGSAIPKRLRPLCAERLADVNVERYPFTSVNRVSWNPNAWSYLWLCVGYQNGLVRFLRFNAAKLEEESSRLLSNHAASMLEVSGRTSERKDEASC